MTWRRWRRLRVGCSTLGGADVLRLSKECTMPVSRPRIALSRARLSQASPRARLAVALVAMLALPGATTAAPVSPASSPLSAEASDPKLLGWMQGAPPPENKRIRYTDDDYFSFPKLRWTACHFRQLMPTVGVSRGPGAAHALPRRLDDAIDALPFTPTGSNTRMTWAQSLAANYTDGIVVLHDGVVVYERYSGCLDEFGQHGAMSVTKSITGLLGEMLVAEGAIDETQRVGAIIPELKDSAFGDATVKQVLEMTTALRYSEDYADPNAEVWAYAAAGSTLPPPAGYTGPRSYYEYLKTVQKQGRHGEAFGYKTINTDALGWIIARHRSIGGAVAAIADLATHRRRAGRLLHRRFHRHTVRGRRLQCRPARSGPGGTAAARRGQGGRPDRGPRRGDRPDPRRWQHAGLRQGRLSTTIGLELSRHVVDLAQRPRCLHGAWRAWPGAVHRSHRTGSDRAVRLAPGGRQQRE